MVQFSSIFQMAESRSTFNASSWKPVGEEYSLKDVWASLHPDWWEQIDGEYADIISTTFQDGNVALKIEVPFKDGSSIQLKLSGRSTLKEGDRVKVSSITAQELTKAGQDPIVRYDAKAE